MCGVLVATRNRDEAIKRLTILADRAPDNLTVLRTLACDFSTWGRSRHRSECRQRMSTRASWPACAAVSPLGRSYADSYRGQPALGQWRISSKPDRLLDGVFASGHPVRLELPESPARAHVRLGRPGRRAGLRCDDPLEAAARGRVHHAREHASGFGPVTTSRRSQTLNRTQREVLHEARIEVPTALLRGDVHAAAGRPGSAAIQWREALEDRRTPAPGQARQPAPARGKGTAPRQIGGSKGRRRPARPGPRDETGGRPAPSRGPWASTTTR